jgi:hypothetical protein
VVREGGEGGGGGGAVEKREQPQQAVGMYVRHGGEVEGRRALAISRRWKKMFISDRRHVLSSSASWWRMSKVPCRLHR